MRLYRIGGFLGLPPRDTEVSGSEAFVLELKPTRSEVEAACRFTARTRSDVDGCVEGGSRVMGRGHDKMMKQLIEDIVKALVDQPEEVQIKEVIGDHAHVLELRVSKQDLGKVIGKGGAHASAIRTLMAAASGKEKKRYILEIVEY